MQIIDLKKLGLDESYAKIQAARSKNSDVRDVVQGIMDDVRINGDAELIRLAQKFDGASLTALQVSEREVQIAYDLIDNGVVEALKIAKRNIEIFHKANVQSRSAVVETMKGVELWREFRPIERVGLYVPGGKASYPSTLLMLAIPAKIAGCNEIVVCCPCDENGSIVPAVLVAADLCGVKKIFKTGGAQAIAAMAYGTESIPKVDKIFGPGNQYVSTAKLMLYGEVDIDMPAGPSELAVIASSANDPVWVAADLLSQLEHGPDSQVIFLTDSKNFLEYVLSEVKRQTNLLSRSLIIEESLKRSFAILYSDLDSACALINLYAPEHLQIMLEDNDYVLSRINNVGSVFLGAYSSESLGDYATGANHTLPTSGYARVFEALSVDAFGKKIQVQKVNEDGFNALAKTVVSLAQAEGLDAHANSVLLRLNS